MTKFTKDLILFRVDVCPKSIGRADLSVVYGKVRVSLQKIESALSDAKKSAGFARCMNSSNS